MCALYGCRGACLRSKAGKSNQGRAFRLGKKKGAVIPPSRRLRSRAPAGWGNGERGTPSRGRSIDGPTKLAAPWLAGCAVQHIIRDLRFPAPIAASSTPRTAVMPIQDHENRVHDEPNGDDEGKHNGSHEIRPAVIVSHANQPSRVYCAAMRRDAGDVTAGGRSKKTALSIGQPNRGKARLFHGAGYARAHLRLQTSVPNPRWKTATGPPRPPMLGSALESSHEQRGRRKG